MRIRIQHFFYWIRIPDPGSGFRIPDPNPGFDDLKLKKIYSWKFFLLFSWSKIAIYLSLGLHKGRPSYRRSLQPSKETFQYFKKWKFCTFFYFFGVIFALLDPDPATQINADPYGSGSETLELRNHFFGLKYLNSLMRIRDLGQFGSGIREKHTWSATLGFTSILFRGPYSMYRRS